MILTFPVDEQTTACIAWGKVRTNRDSVSSSPIYVEECGNGTRKYRFCMNVCSKKIKNAAKKDEWYFEEASVNIWARNWDLSSRTMGDAMKLLRINDVVLVFGSYRSYEWKDRAGQERIGHEITAHVVLPMLWVYHVLLAMFTDIIAKSAPQTTKVVKGAPAPRKVERGNAPKVSHPIPMDDEKDGWFK